MHAHQSHCGPIAIALAFDQHPINRIGRTQGTARFSRHHRERPAMGLRQQHMRQTQHAGVIDGDDTPAQDLGATMHHHRGPPTLLQTQAVFLAYQSLDPPTARLHHPGDRCGGIDPAAACELRIEVVNFTRFFGGYMQACQLRIACINFRRPAHTPALCHHLTCRAVAFERQRATGRASIAFSRRSRLVALAGVTWRKEFGHHGSGGDFFAFHQIKTFEPCRIR